MKTYRVFKRSCRNWQEFKSARKLTVARGLTYGQALERCVAFNEHRTRQQINRGTKLEFESE